MVQNTNIDITVDYWNDVKKRFNMSLKTAPPHKARLCFDYGSPAARRGCYFPLQVSIGRLGLLTRSSGQLFLLFQTYHSPRHLPGMGRVWPWNSKARQRPGRAIPLILSFDQGKGSRVITPQHRGRLHPRIGGKRPSSCRKTTWVDDVIINCYELAKWCTKNLAQRGLYDLIIFAVNCITFSYELGI